MGARLEVKKVSRMHQDMRLLKDPKDEGFFADSGRYLNHRTPSALGREHTDGRVSRTLRQQRLIVAEHPPVNVVADDGAVGEQAGGRDLHRS